MSKKIKKTSSGPEAEQFRKQTNEALNRVEAAAVHVEDLMGRTDATFLGGSLLPMIAYALLHQAREETREAIAGLEKESERSEPGDVIDHTDFFASALGEMAALLKILTTMELEDDPALREDWDKLADDLQALATIIQRAAERFEDALDAAEPDSLIQIKNEK